MAYRSRGLPSAGCNLCRSKKIRCDESKPVCGHCVKIGHPDCKYRDEFERTWRWQTDETLSQKSKPREREHAVQTKKSATALNAASATTARKLTPPKLSPPRQSPPNLSPPEPHILARFFFDWSSPMTKSPGVSITWFNTLSALYKDARPDDLIYMAVGAVANACYGQRFKDPKCVADAVNWCSATLCQLRTGMSASPDSLDLHRVMISIMLLGIYESATKTLIDPSMTSNGAWVSHTTGAALFVSKLSQRGRELASESEIEVAVMISRQMIHGSLITGRPPALTMDDIHCLSPRSLEHAMRPAELVHQAAILLSEWREAFANADTFNGQEHLADLASRGLAMDQALQEVVQFIPPSAHHTAHAISSISPPPWLQPLLDAPGAPHSFYIHTALPQMMWRFHWESRMILAQALLHTNFILTQQFAPINPVAERLDEVEANVLFFADRLSESCVSILARTIAKAEHPENCRIEDIPSLQGYLLLHVLPTVGLCLEQIELRGVDLADRRAWISMMRDFLRDNFGFIKGTEKIDPSRYAAIPIQLWGM